MSGGGAEGGNRMRIGMDARYAFRSQRRGIGQYVAEILSGLARLDIDDTFILYVDAQADTGSLALPEGRFQLRRLVAHNPMVFEEIALPLAARRDRLDLLHLTSNYGPSFPPCPTLYTVHDLIEFLRDEIGPWQLDYRHWLGRAIRQRTLPVQTRKARVVITPSEATRRDVARILRVPDNRIKVIPSGAPAIVRSEDVNGLRASLKKRGYPVPDRYLLALAALDPRKNGGVIVKAFETISREFPQAEVWLVGIEDISSYPKYDAPWLRVFGYLPRTDVMDILRAADAFVFPSKYEGFGFPALEAMAAGVPLIASNSSSIPEVVGDAGILFAPNDAGALASGMREVLQGGDQVEARRQEALRRAAAFNWSETARRHLEAYRAAAGDAS